MDERREIKLKRVLPTALSGLALILILAFAIFAMTPNERMKRSIAALLVKYGFEQVGKNKEELDGYGNLVTTELFEAPLLTSVEINQINSRLSGLLGDGDHSYRNIPITITYMIYGFTAVDRLKFEPHATNDFGDQCSRITVRRS